MIQVFRISLRRSYVSKNKLLNVSRFALVYPSPTWISLTLELQKI